MSTKTTAGVAPKKSSLGRFVLLALLVIGLYLVLQDPTGSAEAINAAWSSLTTFGNNLHIGGGGS